MSYSDSHETDDLLNFIIKKRELIEHTLPSQLLYLFCKSIKISLINTYKEQKDLNLCIHCVNIVESIFRLIYNYSLNIKLSIFICERSVLLFNEYINISKSYNSDKINIQDIKQFIINKSIGPVIINSEKTIINKYDPLLKCMKSFMCTFFINNISNDSIKESDLYFNMENIIRTLSTSLIDIYNKNLLHYIESELNIFKSIEPDNLLENINLLKIKFELLLFLSEKVPVSTILNKINNIININDTIIKQLLLEFNDDGNIQESLLFKKLIKNI
tara:strand:- start:986 stop:1807 length:822 start_codon:yes stop_codon:yes gene_type:complete